MIDSSIGDQTKAVCTDPFPVDNILTHRCRLQFLLLAEVEDLECSRLRLQCNDLSVPVHDRTVSLDRPFDDIIVVLEVDDDNVRVIGIGRVLLSYTDIVIRFEGLAQVSTCAVYKEERLLSYT